MMKKLTALTASAVMAATLFTSCGVPENTVHSIDDLKGKTIGVQLGTTGDIFAEDVEDAKIEKYNKGAGAGWEGRSEYGLIKAWKKDVGIRTYFQGIWRTGFIFLGKMIPTV